MTKNKLDIILHCNYTIEACKFYTFLHTLFHQLVHVSISEMKDLEITPIACHDPSNFVLPNGFVKMLTCY
jgi:hypothetical protein